MEPTRISQDNGSCVRRRPASRGCPAAWAASTAGNRWRAFEVTTRVEILNPSGLTRAWVPLPLTEDTDYHKTLGRTWNGNAASAQAVPRSAVRRRTRRRRVAGGHVARRSRWSPGSPRATARST